MGRFYDFFKKPRLSDGDEAFLRTLVEKADDPELDAEMQSVFEEVDPFGDDVRHAYAGVYRMLRRQGRERMAGRMFKALGVAALVVAGMVAGYFISGIRSRAGEDIRQAMWTELRVPQGDTRDVTLCDGTVLSLSAGSRLTYPDRFAGGIRQVFLDGEVYATVHGDSEHPFVISSGNMDVKVTGTTFIFKAYSRSDRVELMLMEGQVNFLLNNGDKTREAILAPGNILHYDRSLGDVMIDAFEVGSVRPSGGNQPVRFFNLKLSDIALDLENRFGVRIVIESGELAGKRFFAIFSNGEGPREILHALNTGKSMRLRERENVIYISKI